MKRLKGSCSVLPAIARHFLPIYLSFYTTILCQIAAPRSLFSHRIRHHKTVKLRAERSQTVPPQQSTQRLSSRLPQIRAPLRERRHSEAYIHDWERKMVRTKGRFSLWDNRWNCRQRQRLHSSDCAVLHPRILWKAQWRALHERTQQFVEACCLIWVENQHLFIFSGASTELNEAARERMIREGRKAHS